MAAAAKSAQSEAEPKAISLKVLVRLATGPTIFLRFAGYAYLLRCADSGRGSFVCVSHCGTPGELPFEAFVSEPVPDGW